MWYVIVLAVATIQFWIGYNQILLQAAIREKVEFREIADQFPRFDWRRVTLFFLMIAVPSALHLMADSAAFIFALGALFFIALTVDFISAARIAEGANHRTRRLG